MKPLQHLTAVWWDNIFLLLLLAGCRQGGIMPRLLRIKGFFILLPSSHYHYKSLFINLPGSKAIPVERRKT